MSYFSFCHSHLLSDGARDSTAKLCPSVKSATRAGCFLILHMNCLMYCYQRKKKQNKQQSQLCSLVLPCKKEFRSNSPGQQGLEMLETTHSAPRREGTSGRFWTTPLWLMPEAVLIWLWNTSQSAFFNQQINIMHGFWEELDKRWSLRMRKELVVAYERHE